MCLWVYEVCINTQRGKLLDLKATHFTNAYLRVHSYLKLASSKSFYKLEFYFVSQYGLASHNKFIMDV